MIRAVAWFRGLLAVPAVSCDPLERAPAAVCSCSDHCQPRPEEAQGLPAASVRPPSANQPRAPRRQMTFSDTAVPVPGADGADRAVKGGEPRPPAAARLERRSGRGEGLSRVTMRGKRVPERWKSPWHGQSGRGCARSAYQRGTDRGSDRGNEGAAGLRGPELAAWTRPQAQLERHGTARGASLS